MITTIKNIQNLSESIELECKLATGRDGKGALPKKTFWETYSAFANTDGGTILLGVRENKDHSFEIEGITDTQKILDELWTSVANSETISCNLLQDENVQILTIDGKSVIEVVVPRASRHDKPVHRTTNPMEGTYQRLHSSDVKCSKETVRRMLSEQLEDSRDDKLLENYTMDDIDVETLRVYRQIYISRDASNERNRYDDVEFLRSIGAWKKDRKSGVEGLTIAGLLMFGKMMSIQEEFPNYMLDYQERAESSSDSRWIDRISLDGTWSGNLFDFYTRVIRKLTLDLKVPFQLQGDQRQDSTPVHDALREALVNTIVHADYSDKASILVIKYQNMFIFRNPGLMRVSVEQAISGYEHDCRNQKLHQIFHFIGLGERAGSGIPNIFKWWEEKHWIRPSLSEKLEPYQQTILELRMSNETLGLSSGGMGVSSGGYIVDGLSYHIFDSLNSMEDELKESLNAIAKPVIDSKRFPKQELKIIVKELCAEKYLTLAVLAELLNRTEDYIRKDILNPMVDQEELLRAFPKTPNDPRQAYTSTKVIKSRI